MTIIQDIRTAPERTFLADYLETLSLVERLHRLLLDVIKDEFERLGILEINAVQALLLFNIGENEVTAGELKSRGYYQGSNVSYNLKKLVDLGYMHHQRCQIDRRSVRVRLTAKGRELNNVDPQAVKRYIAAEQRKKAHIDAAKDELETVTEQLSWREELMHVLLNMDPSAFERLTQRLLRESGFIQVEVTGRSGDGGIDGKGIMRLGGLLSFHVIFQCKRYRGSVSAGQVRDFRGAMVGRADKGLLITTGNFTKDAVREATRDGAPAIDLVDGDSLVEKLRELALGVETRRIEVEQITIDPAWFAKI